jgi:hypothetical protein
MVSRSRAQTRVKLEVPAPELEELARRYHWLRYVQTLDIYRRSPLALLGLAQGLRGSLGLGIASNRDALIIGGASPLKDLYRAGPGSLVDALAMAVMANGHADAILGDLDVRGALLTQVELLGEAVRLGLRLVMIAEPKDQPAIEAAASLGWQVETLAGGDLFEGWSLGRSLWHRFQSVVAPVVVVVHGDADSFDVGELGDFGAATLRRFDREAVEAASRLADDPRPELARAGNRRRLAALIAEAHVDSLGAFVELVRARLGTAAILVGREVFDEVEGIEGDELIRVTDPTVLAKAVSRWGGFPIVLRAKSTSSPGIPCLALTLDHDLRPGSAGVLVHSQESFAYFASRLLGEATQPTHDYLIVSSRLRRDGFGHLEASTGRWLRPQGELAVITWGQSVQVALHACVLLADVGSRIGVLELHQPGLIDEKLMAQAVKATRVCILYDQKPDVGYQLVTYLQEYFYAQLSAPVMLRSAGSGPGPVAVLLRGLLA